MTTNISVLSAAYPYKTEAGVAEAECPSLSSATTLHELFVESARKAPHHPFQFRRCIQPSGELDAWTAQTYREVALVVRRKCDVYHKLGLGKGSKFGIYGRNSPEWLQTAISSDHISAITVPLDVSFTVDELCEILHQEEINFVAVQDVYLEKLVQAIEALPEEASVALKGIDVWSARIEFNSCKKETVESLRRKDIAVMVWNNARGIIRAHVTEHPTAEDPAAIIYSRTDRGLKKEVVTHRAMMDNVRALCRWKMQKETKIRMVSSLSLSRPLARALESMVMAMNGAIGYFQDSEQSLCSVLRSFSPTTLATDAAGVADILTEILDEASLHQPSLMDTVYKQAKQLIRRSSSWYRSQTPSEQLHDSYLSWKSRNRLHLPLKTCLYFGNIMEQDTQQFILSTISNHFAKISTSMEGSNVVAINDSTTLRAPNWMGSPLPQHEIQLKNPVQKSNDIISGELCFHIGASDPSSSSAVQGETSVSSAEEKLLSTGLHVELNLTHGTLFLQNETT